MKKLHLSLDSLKVESFTAGAGLETRGTVRARSTYELTMDVACYTNTCEAGTWDEAHTCAGDPMCADPE